MEYKEMLTEEAVEKMTPEQAKEYLKSARFEFEWLRRVGIAAKELQRSLYNTGYHIPMSQLTVHYEFNEALKLPQ